MLLLYCQTLTPRLQYIVNFFSAALFDAPVQVTTNKEEYRLAVIPKLNYSEEEICEDELMIRPVPLLFETGIRVQDTSCFEINYHKAFFQTAGDLHFDLFAAAFYLLSRYEEYLPNEKDEYGRYAYAQSLAYKEGFLHQPLVNIWIQEFKKLLSRKFPGMAFKNKAFANMLSYDIDMAYSYLHKGFLRNLGGALRSIVKGQWKLLAERLLVLLKVRKDPFDCYEWLDALHLYCRLKPYYFFLAAKQRSRYDKNTPTNAKAFRDIIEYYSATYDVGIHPSWQSYDRPALMKEELEWMEAVTGKRIVNSRQHYIRLNLPATYRQLMAIGIQKDFSMGYGGINGFRASVCSPFYWYDLEGESATELMVYPFCFMDANAFYKQHYTPMQAYSELMKYYDEVKKVSGTMITIWHNTLLGAASGTEGWKEMFELFMKETVYWDAYSN
ncbi:MAG: polysaccharide deacetylase family protein [Chitinophagaceae bacterium]|nr:polysaccharide deacetylase family protein [Chitinophagaceae bacterium]